MIPVALIVTQALPLGVATEPRWPESYLCSVVTDDVEVVEFSAHLSDGELVLDRDIFSISKDERIRFEKSGTSLKSGESHFRVLVSTSLPNGRIWLTQAGSPTHPSTNIFIDLGARDISAAVRRPQMSGYCKVDASKGAKEVIQ